MEYTFPTITCLDDVLPAIEGASEFSVTKKDGYQVVNYFMTNPHETFPEVPKGHHSATYARDKYAYLAAIRRECRGLIFDEEGKLISRPYHKFFNLNERTETQNIDLNKPHVILEKLDGSMIRPLFLGKSKRPRWATKAGITDVSMQVETWLVEHPIAQSQYEAIAVAYHRAGWTPIFEWCSRKQRIVLDYPNDQLILTAVRNNTTGEYMSQNDMLLLDAAFTLIPVVGTRKIPELDEKDSEGVVIRFDDGHMVKVKTDWYVLRHKALDGLRSEKNVLKLILDNGIDDVLPLLDEATKKRLEDYTHEIQEHVGTSTWHYREDVRKRKDLPRRDFAEWAKTTEYPWLAFKILDGEDCGEATWAYVAKNLSSQTTVDKIRPLLGAIW